MKVAIFIENMQFGAHFSFIKPKIVELPGVGPELMTAQLAAQIAQMQGAPIKRAFQDTGTEDGTIILGVRYKPVAIIVPETSPLFRNSMIITGKLAK